MSLTLLERCVISCSHRCWPKHPGPGHPMWREADVTQPVKCVHWPFASLKWRLTFSGEWAIVIVLVADWVWLSDGLCELMDQERGLIAPPLLPFAMLRWLWARFPVLSCVKVAPMIPCLTQSGWGQTFLVVAIRRDHSRLQLIWVWIYIKAYFS